MNQILSLDQYLYYLVNTGLSNTYSDAILPYFRNPPNWIPLYFFFAAFVVINFGRRGWYIILLAILTIAISDQISSSIIKPLIHRVRPCNDPQMEHHVRLLLKNCGAGFSFPSSHAVNHFAIAMFLITILPNSMKWVRPALLIWAGIVAFAQVYVGVHYPIDVIFGALLGSLIGMFVAGLGKTVLHIDLSAETSE